MKKQVKKVSKAPTKKVPKKKVKESQSLRYNGLLFEDIVNLKKNKRSVSDAKSGAQGAVIKGFNPYEVLVKQHKEAAKAVLKGLKNEFKKAKTEENKITISTNYIKNGQFVQPKSGILEIGIHLYMPAKKGFFGRLFSGSMGNWFSELGVKAMQTYVNTFGGPEFAKQVSKKTVFNAVGEGENEGKVSYFCCLKIPNSED